MCCASQGLKGVVKYRNSYIASYTIAQWGEALTRTPRDTNCHDLYYSLTRTGGFPRFHDCFFARPKIIYVGTSLWLVYLDFYLSCVNLTLTVPLTRVIHTLIVTCEPLLNHEPDNIKPNLHLRDVCNAVVN